MKALMDERNLDLIFLSLTLPVHCVDHFSQEECGRGEEDRTKECKLIPIISEKRKLTKTGNVYGNFLKMYNLSSSWFYSFIPISRQV